MQPQTAVKGIHHVALTTLQTEQTVRFYADLLGLQPHQEPLHRSEPAHQLLSLGDGTGSAITITEVANGSEGELGIGTVHHVALTVPSLDALLKWKRWLQYNDILVYGPYDQQAYQDIIFADPDGVLLELATAGPGWEATQDGKDLYYPPKETIAPYRDEELIRAHTWPHPVTQIEPDMVLQGFHHISTIVSSLDDTDHFYRHALGLPLIRKSLDHDDPEVQHWYWGLDGGRPGTLISGFPIVHEQEGGKAVYGRAGIGVVDHFALEVAGDEVAIGILDAGKLTQKVEASPSLIPGTTSVAVRSPDGQVVDLVTPIAGPPSRGTDEDHAASS